MFQLPNVKMLDKRGIFPVKSQKKRKKRKKERKEKEGKYVKKSFLVSKRLIQFLNKATYNFFLYDKGTRDQYI